MKKVYLTKILRRINKLLKNAIWLFLVAMAIQAFFFKEPYPVAIGIMFFMMSFVFVPLENIIVKHTNIKLSTVKKIYLLISMFLAMAYCVPEKNSTYLHCLYLFLVILTIWVIVFIITIKKQDKSNK